MNHKELDEITDEEWQHTFATNVSAMFYLVKAAVPHMPPGSSIIGSTSVNSDMPSPELAPYAVTKAAIANFCASLARGELWHVRTITGSLIGSSYARGDAFRSKDGHHE